MLTALEKRDKDGEFTWKRGRTPYRHWVCCRQRRITLELRDRRVIASYRIDKNPDNTPAALLRRTLWRNGGQSAADFHYAADGTIRARMIHPIADMDVTELIYMLRELRGHSPRHAGLMSPLLPKCPLRRIENTIQPDGPG